MADPETKAFIEEFENYKNLDPRQDQAKLLLARSDKAIINTTMHDIDLKCREKQDRFFSKTKCRKPKDMATLN